MTAIGLGLLLFGLVFNLMGVNPSKDHSHWDFRDVLVTIPVGIGFLLALCGFLIWFLAPLWRLLP